MKFVAAAVQMVASDEKMTNLEEAERWIREAAGKGASLVALPEVFVWRGSKRAERAQAEPIPGPSTLAMSKLARHLHIYLLAGSVLEEIPGGARAYNTSVLISPSGEIIATYRKIHLFDVDLANGVSLRESETRAPGEAVVIARTELCMMGLSICYDLRFPELYRALAEQGAEVILVPSAFTAYTGEAHWESLLRARAIENQSYIIAPAQFGESRHSFRTHGHSMIVDPWGKIVGELPDGAGVITAEIDLEYLAKVRAALPALAHRRLS
jgi:predicted amidohydrolase